ncbi:Pancreatic triacylglycerol lipase [Acropora cervicornis]|uniref:Pancreatic triacylglycerol lipase n=1 Tax=Acropora cervicornis TaxID=6130 RepID=A0AAD9V499_ACRCE|nr:Pancreatic triacylglycerol lipase [Acropora cervicornis]
MSWAHKVQTGFAAFGRPATSQVKLVRTMNGIYVLMLVIWSSFFSFTQSKVVFKEVCYGKYGCFSKAPPFDDRLVMSPQDPSIVNTTFSLYTRSNKHKAHLIDDEDEEKLYDSNFEISKRTIIISHGWTAAR